MRGKLQHQMRLFFSAFFKLIFGAILVALLLFAPAGTFAFPGAWRLLILLFVPMIFIGIFFYFFAPETLSRRLRSKESRAKQKGVVALSGILFIINFLLAGLDFKFGWSSLPSWVFVEPVFCSYFRTEFMLKLLI